MTRPDSTPAGVDASGVTHESTHDVAGSEANGASVDTTTCEVSGDDFSELCSVWDDPDFDPDAPAFYYARVLENESCRWNTWICNANAVDCSETPPPGFEACCDGSVPATIQERAYTSPIWYGTEGPAAVPGLAAWGPLPLALVAALLAAAGWAGVRRR